MFFTRPLPPRANFHSMRSNIVPVENACFKEHGTINNLVCIFYLSVYAFIHELYQQSVESGKWSCSFGYKHVQQRSLSLIVVLQMWLLFWFVFCLVCQNMFGGREWYSRYGVKKRVFFLTFFSREEIVMSIAVFNLD